jgi:hypothetical protein
LAKSEVRGGGEAQGVADRKKSFQAIINPEHENSVQFKQAVLSVFSTIGAGLTFLEVTCYIILFRYIWHHNNNIASLVVDSKIIRCLFLQSFWRLCLMGSSTPAETGAMGLENESHWGIGW